jgi:hypothetical protein
MFLRSNTRAAVKLGGELAEQLAAAQSKKTARAPAVELQHFLHRVDTEVRPLGLGWLGRARLANAFKWKLRETGLAADVVDELTQLMLTRLSGSTDVTPAPIRPNRAMRRRLAKKS